MILIIRGHIRNSFESEDLINFIKRVYDLEPNLKIFIHTWNVFANNVSWRHITENNNPVTEEIIYDYFDNLKHLIDHIIIDDDSKIQLIGNLEGKINNNSMPIIGWKNYWYGKHKIVEYLHNKNININDDEMIVNLRFDLLNNSNSFDGEFLINFIKSNIGIKFTKNVFAFNGEEKGIDNIYIGNINVMYKLTRAFFYELDEILRKNCHVYHQETLVYRINNEMFINL